MKIAYVCADPGVPVFGYKGSSIHIQEIVSALIRSGAKVKLFASKIGGEIPSGLENIEINKLPIFNGENKEIVSACNHFIRERLEQKGPFDLVYERYSLWSFSAMEYANSLCIPGVLEINSPLIEEQVKYRQLPNRALADLISERVFRTANVLIAVSNEISTYLRRYSYTHQKVHVVPNGVNPNRFTENPNYSRIAFPVTFTVGFVGTLKPWHGLTILIDAFAHLHQKLPNSRLMVVGDGPERDEIVMKLKDRNLLHFTEITGAVVPSEIPRLLSSMNVAVAPYPPLEHFYFSPLKVYEYMAAGLPVVASKIGQLTELIQDGVNGILVPPGDFLALSMAIERLYYDPRLRKRLGSRARQSVANSHTWDAVVDHILDLSRDVSAFPLKSRVSDGDMT